MNAKEVIPVTFQDVWEKYETDATVVALFESMGTMPLSSCFAQKTGEKLPRVQPVFDHMLNQIQEPEKMLSFHIFIARCGEYRVVSKGTKKRKFDDHRRFQELKTPSQFGKHENWPISQQNEKIRIMCSRPSDASLINITLMHPIFQKIIDALESGEPKPEDYELAARLACFQPDSFDHENHRRDGVNQLLNASFANKMNSSITVQQVGPKSQSQSDGSVDGLFFVEYNNEKGKGDTDPYMQNGCYYAQYWSVREGPLYHCCPCLMMEVVGQEIGLSGGAWACGSPCVQPLSSNVPFLDLPLNRNIKEMQVRLCMALRIGFSGLVEWYRNVVPTLSQNPQAQFPYKRTFTDENGTNVSLQYKDKLSRDFVVNAVFLATRLDTKEDVIVKFTPWYGESVHKLLADNDLAPKLFACTDVAGMKMIVMEYCTGTEMWPDSPSADQVMLLKKAESLLRENNLVHGDLRKFNVLVQGDKIRIIDFDWSGTAVITKYPVCLNSKVDWHADARVGCAIELTHDEYMVQQLCKNALASSSV